MRALRWLAVGALALQGVLGAPAMPDFEELSNIPPEDAVVLDPAGDWQPVHWPDSPHSRIVGLDQDDGYPRMLVAEPGKRHPWERRLAIPVDPRQYSILVMTYRATGIQESDERFLWLDDTTGPAKGGIQPFVNLDLVPDGEIHEIHADLRDFSPKGEIITIRIYPHCRGPEPAVFELLGLRFEPAEDAPPAAVQGGEEFTVRVLDEQGKPIGGAWLTVDAERLNWCRSARTGPGGEASVRALANPLGRHILRIETEGMLPVDLPAGSGREVRMLRAVNYGGTVVDEAGRAVPHASVDIRARAGTVSRTVVSLTDADGRWRASTMPTEPQQLAVTVRHPDYVSEEMRDLDLGKLTEGEAVLTLRRGVLVRGFVVGPDGTCLPGARVRQGQNRWHTNHPAVTTDHDGIFEFPKSAPENLVLTVQHPGFAPELVKVDERGDMENLVIELARPHAIWGRVVDGDGLPLGGVRVAVFNWRGYQTITWNMTTEEDGVFGWENAPADAVSFEFMKSGVDTFFYTLRASEDEQVVVMPGPLHIEGRVRDARTGQPVADCKVIPGFVLGPASHPPRIWQRGRAVEVVDGRYAITLNPNPRRGGPATEDRLVLRTEASGYAPQVTEEFTSSGGTKQIDFSLEPGIDIRGRVLLDGRPTAGARVFLVAADTILVVRDGQRTAGTSLSHPPTADDGSFSFPMEIPPWRLVAIHDHGYGELDATGYEQSPELILQPWARVEGVCRLGGKAVPNRRLMMSPIRTQWEGEPRVRHEQHAVTDDEGRFVFPRMPPGGAILGFSASWAPHYEVVTRGEACEFGPGEVVHVVLDGSGRLVVGKLAPARNWSEARGLIHSYENIPLPWGGTLRNRYGVTIAPDGSFRAEHLPPGDYHLGIAIRGAAVHRPYQFTVPEPAGEAEDELLDLGILTPR